MTLFEPSGLMFDWVLPLGFVFLTRLSLGNWNYVLRARRKIAGSSIRDAVSILN